VTPDFEIGQGDLLPPFQRQLLNADGTAEDLTGKTVIWRVRTPGCCARELESTGTIVDARGGYVSHDWQAAETLTPGIVYVYAVATAAGSEPRAYPPPPLGCWTVRVLPQLR
jgi:hypothetical protein